MFLKRGLLFFTALAFLAFAGQASAGPNANATVTIDLITDGGAGNQTDDGVHSGNVSGEGTKIAVEVFAKGVTTALVGVQIVFDFKAEELKLDKVENSAFLFSIPEPTGVNFAGTAPVTLPESGFIGRAEFSTVADVTGQEFTLGIKAVTLAESAASIDVITTADVISFNATSSPDFDGDGAVGFSDFLAFAGQYGARQGDGQYEARYDLDGDGAISFSDFLAFASSYGTQVPPSGGGGGGGSSQTCTVGLTLNPGDRCSGSTYSLQNDSGVLITYGSIGGVSFNNARFSLPSVNLNGLRLTRSGNVWTIDSLPGGSSGGGSDGGGSSGSPDLVVESPSVSDSTLTTGQSFTLSATVRNQGTGASAATTLRYYQSSNATISTSDTEVGTDSVGGLSASGTSAESVSLNAPSSAGTYYYGACVNSVTGESDTNNNCSDAVTVTVSSSGSGGGGGGGSSQACTVGLTLNPGDGCSGSTYSLQNDSGVLVLDGNIGGLRMGNTRISGNNVNLNGLRLTRSGNVWTIVSLP